MPSGIHGLSGERVFGAAGQPQNTAVLMDTIYKLKQDLQRSDEEKRALAEQLNCLVLLVKRSWSGDQNASLHLGNIVGVTPPDIHGPVRDHTNTPIPDDKTQAVYNWERLAIRLLDREYQRVQEEIRQQQMMYIENRQHYMDELLVSHQKEMSKVPIKRQTKSLEEVDQRFMKTFQRRAASGVRPHSNIQTRRVKSAGVQRQNSQSDSLNGTNLTLNDIINPNQSHLSQNTNSAFSGLYKLDSDNGERAEYYDRVQYDDPNRYKPSGNIFDLDAVFGPDNQEKPQKPRPISAFMPKERSKTLSRPQSAVFLTQRNERPLKNETTRPVSGKPSNKQQTRRKKSGAFKSTNESAIRICPFKENQPEEPQNENEKECVENKQEYGEDDSEEEDREPSMKINIGNYKKRPQHVDKFAADLKQMELMEEEFKKNTLQLQKKLGVTEMGIIY